MASRGMARAAVVVPAGPTRWPVGGRRPGGQAGNLRTSYVLPSAALRVAGAGVVWPLPGEPLAEAVAAAGPHHLVWVDIEP